jgi:hypothetical protein
MVILTKSWVRIAIDPAPPLPAVTPSNGMGRMCYESGQPHGPPNTRARTTGIRGEALSLRLDEFSRTAADVISATALSQASIAPADCICAIWKNILSIAAPARCPTARLAQL